MYMNMIYKTKDITLNLLWKIILNTYFLLHSSKYILNKMKPIITSIFYTKKSSSIQFIKNGIIVYELFVSNNINILNNVLNIQFKNIKYDFILYQYVNEVEEYDNIYFIRYNNINELIEKKLIFEKSKINFFTIILEYNSVRMNITLNCKTEYYYITNNILLDYNFIQYYIYKHYNLLINSTEKYEICILDHNCKIINLQKINNIILKDHNYIVTNTNIENLIIDKNACDYYADNDNDDDECWDEKKYVKKIINDIINKCIEDLDNENNENNENT